MAARRCITKGIAVALLSALALACFFQLPSLQESVTVMLAPVAMPASAPSANAPTESSVTVPSEVARTQFRDEYFAPILTTFRTTPAFVKLTKFRSGSVPKILFVIQDKLANRFWSESLAHFRNNECPLPCTFTDNIAERGSADAILVYYRHIKSLKDLNDKLPNRDLTQPWIVHSNETPLRASNKYKIPARSMDGVFNRTMFYRRDADIVWTHGFFVSKEDAKYLPSSWQSEIPSIDQTSFSKRKIAVAFISNCANTGGRMEYIRELSKLIQVDIFGKCGEHKCGGTRYVDKKHRVENDSCLKQVAREYLFYLSFENAICEDYVTEKAYNIQYYPVVPIVYGGADYTKLLPPNSYIDALQFTPKQLAKLLMALAADEAKYKAMLAWREHYVVSTVAERRIYCQLCSKLYDPEFYAHNTYNDFHDWFVGKSNCRQYSVSRNESATMKIE